MQVYIVMLIMFYSLSSLFMCVFGDDRVTCYTGADHIVGDVVDE